MKRVFRFSLPYYPEAFIFLRGAERDIIINAHRSSRKVSVIVDFNQNSGRSQIFEKHPNVKFHLKQVSSGCRVVP
jgi:hypothetical protein